MPFNISCNNSDGENFCDCQVGDEPRDDCMFYGRKAEPLAFALQDQPMREQGLCPLFSVLPYEIRQDVYEYAFTDCTANPTNAYNVHRENPFSKDSVPQTDVAANFLQTCRAVYLEAYQMPFLLNPYIVYTFAHRPAFDVAQPKLNKIAPWQFALIQRLDISLQQTQLEGGKLQQYLQTWRPQERHDGILVAPRMYRENVRSIPAGLLRSFNFGLDLQSLVDGSEGLKDGDSVEMRINNAFYSGYQKYPPSTMIAKAMKSRPITHLTLRLTHRDWWTWTSHPSAQDSRLGLDPALGSGSENSISAGHMTFFADERRKDRWPNMHYVGQSSQRKYACGWGAQIAKLPDLKCLELVMETFNAKKDQLDEVVACASTWTFPLDDTGYQLIWYGQVDAQSWNKGISAQNSIIWAGRTAANSGQWYHEAERHMEVRIMRFKRVKV